MRWVIYGLMLMVGAQMAGPPLGVAADLETIQARGYLIVAVRDDWPPLSFLDAAGNLAGLEIDLARQLAQVIFDDPNAILFETVSNQERLPAVLEDQVDMAIAGLTLTPERQRLVSFSLPYYLDGVGFLVRDPRFQRWQDLQGQRIGLLQGSSAIPVVRQALPQAHLTPLASYQQALLHLERGQIDAFAGDGTVLVGWQQEQPGYTLLPGLLSAYPLAIALPKGTQYSDLRNLVNQALGSWHDNGWLEDRIRVWGLP
ncbi:MAG TPA: transporter substrate-binding domain-containing protein [Leptolyngbyaceae cyanobacterium M65_K2018_010]|nr:transporter substrate-binding domain-containing protein [Leptolyngbyaceae cyanobacterium M65_K2018_010]